TRNLVSIMPWTSLVINKPSPSSYEPLPASLDSGSSKANARKPMTYSLLCTTGSLRVLTPLTCKRRRHCWMRWCNTTPVDTPLLPLQYWVCVHKSMNVKHFHGILSGRPHAYSLKSYVGKVSLNLSPEDVIREFGCSSGVTGP